jgi:TctA family transporter
MLENNLRKGMTYTDQGILPFFTRPISGALLLAATASVVWPLIKDARAKRKTAAR